MIDPASYKAQVARSFNDAATRLNPDVLRFLPFCADRLVLQLNPARGSKVLDCATGTGAAAIAAAQAVGSGGRVIGVDIAEDMLVQAQKAVSKMSLSQVDLHLMDAEALEFRAHYFDYVICSLGLAYLPQRDVALASWVRALRPGGKIMITTFGAQAFRPLLDLFVAQAATVGINAGEAVSRSIRGLGDERACTDFLARPGLKDIHAQTRALGYYLRNAEEWWAVLSFVVLPSLGQEIAPDLLAQLKALHLPAVARLATEHGIFLGIETVLSGATV